ncbi:MAG: FkbM family methyltransferase [Acidobacteria bacterium]|nr:FkbM family methyltransferase [Acidobacteriota bacterium]MBS1866149.1 FkbM family methyltransferase [Acidobacteriota bacterium]
MHELYSQFMRPGDLVFDIGANVGEYTEMFARLGARVVAVEANPELIGDLEKIRPRNLISVESVAVGPREGAAELYICQENLLSSLSRDWITVAQKSDRLSRFEWKKSTLVPVTTLDALIEKYGRPRFIKIDVEGFELEVLAGLTQAPEVMSFEFNSEYAQQAKVCLRQECIRPGCLFNVTMESNMSLLFERWLTIEELLAYLRRVELKSLHTWGDIFVKTKA